MNIIKCPYNCKLCLKFSDNIKHYKCKELKKILYKNYHNHSDPYEEFLLRINYLILFNFIDEDDLKNTSFIIKKTIDDNHRKWLLRLINDIINKKIKTQYFNWIEIKQYIYDHEKKTIENKNIFEKNKNNKYEEDLYKFKENNKYIITLITFFAKKDAYNSFLRDTNKSEYNNSSNCNDYTNHIYHIYHISNYVYIYYSKNTQYILEIYEDIYNFTYSTLGYENNCYHIFYNKHSGDWFLLNNIIKLNYNLIKINNESIITFFAKKDAYMSYNYGNYYDNYIDKYTKIYNIEMDKKILYEYYDIYHKIYNILDYND